VTQNGAVIPTYLSYETEDGAIYCGGISTYGAASNPHANITIMRGGTYRNVILPKDGPGGTGSTAYAMLWGDYVAIVNTTTSSCLNARFFSRTSFDAWLQRIADYYGFPT